MSSRRTRKVKWKTATTKVEEADFSTIDELIAIPFIHQWYEREEFLSFSTIEYKESNTWGLLLTHSTEDGRETRQIAHVSDGEGLDFSSVNRQDIETEVRPVGFLRRIRKLLWRRNKN